MKAREFFDLVTNMRSAQKSYFRSRSKEDLQKSFALEKAVDNEIERVHKILNKLKDIS